MLVNGFFEIKLVLFDKSAVNIRDYRAAFKDFYNKANQYKQTHPELRAYTWWPLIAV